MALTPKESELVPVAFALVAKADDLNPSASARVPTAKASLPFAELLLPIETESRSAAYEETPIAIASALSA